MFRIILLLLMTGLFSGRLPAQMPQSDVYLFDMVPQADSAYTFSNPRWLTHFNPNGYNNHPSFVEDDLLYLSVQMPNQDQPEIVALNLRDTTRVRVTATNSGEYSPARMPDFYNFSAVRMEFRGQDTLLRLWQFPLRRQPNDVGKPVFKYITNIGYYHWLSNQQVALFLTEETPVLAIANLYNDQVQRIATNVGRTFRTLPNGRLVYLQKNEYGPAQLMEVDPRAPGRPQLIINALNGSEDFAILNDGTILMAQGSKLYKFKRPRDGGWIEVADFSYYDISNITRLAVSRDGKLAFVGS